MAENSKIEWCHHTFNPWIGCMKVGPGCDHCYAEALMDVRRGKAKWGAGQPRVRTAESTWKQPLAWNRKAAAAGIRQRVFCSSLADVFDNEVDPAWRHDLADLITATPNLDWLLLTKRIGNAALMLDAMFDAPPPNVWLGATIVNQAEADRDIPKLLATPAAKRFLSMEPLLGPVDIRAFIDGCYECGASCGLRLPGPPEIERCVECGEECGPDTEPVISEGCPKCGGELEFICPDCSHYMVYQHPDTPVLDWIIVGGESGPGARPMHPDWARSLRDQCAAAGVPFLMKQWGEWAPAASVALHRDTGREHRNAEGISWLRDGRICCRDFSVAEHERRIRDREATCMRAVEVDWDALRDFYATLDLSDGPVNPLGYQWMYRIGKKAAGRLLDGVQHDGVPA